MLGLTPVRGSHVELVPAGDLARCGLAFQLVASHAAHTLRWGRPRGLRRADLGGQLVLAGPSTQRTLDRTAVLGTPVEPSRLAGSWVLSTARPVGSARLGARRRAVSVRLPSRPQLSWPTPDPVAARG